MEGQWAAGTTALRNIIGRIPASERLLFASDLTAVGMVRCVPDSDHFAYCGPSRTDCVVFPRGAVIIRRDSGESFVEDAGAISFYRRGQEYERVELGREGDCCDWFALHPDIAGEITAALHADGTIDRGHIPGQPVSCPAQLYIHQRDLFEAIRRGLPVEAMSLDEAVIALCHDAVRAAFQRCPTDPPTRLRVRELASAARAAIDRRFWAPLNLSLLAADLNASPFQLCRAFRATFGTTMSQHATTLRLRAALNSLSDYGSDLGQLAHELGFNSHSHFTWAFKQHYGRTPSQARRRLLAR